MTVYHNLSIFCAMSAAVLAESTAGDFFKLCAEMALGGKTQISCYFDIGVV